MQYVCALLFRRNPFKLSKLQCVYVCLLHSQAHNHKSYAAKKVHSGNAHTTYRIILEIWVLLGFVCRSGRRRFLRVGGGGMFMLRRRCENKDTAQFTMSALCMVTPIRKCVRVMKHLPVNRSASCCCALL